MTFDWEPHKYGKGVDCTFTPRPEVNGRSMMPEMAQHIGKTVKVVPLWLMDENDPYPGEWALGAADRRSDVFGRGWIASGDMLPRLLEIAKGA